jgi:hypothetical protein
MRVGVVGVGNVGARVVRQLLSSSDVSSIVVSDSKAGRADEVVRLIKESHVTASATPWDGATVTVLASAPGDHRNIAQTALRQGSHVVSVSDSIPDVRALLELDYEAASRGRSVVVGAAMAPGLTGLLTRLAARPFDVVEEIHVAAAGTGGPACARQHHAALGGDAVDWRDGAFIDRRGRSGRELVFFPEPIGGRDCYRAALRRACRQRGEIGLPHCFRCCADPTPMEGQGPYESRCAVFVRVANATLRCCRRSITRRWLPLLLPQLPPKPCWMDRGAYSALEDWQQCKIPVRGCVSLPAVA